MLPSKNKIYKTKEGRSFVFIRREETEAGYMDNPWRYCFQSLDTGGEIWCSLEGIKLVYPIVEDLIQDGI